MSTSEVLNKKFISSTIPFGCYQERIRVLVSVLINRPITGDWWAKQKRADGQHRTWTHYLMGISCEQSAQEMLPFAEAQILRPHPKSDHWKDVCSVWEKG